MQSVSFSGIKMIPFYCLNIHVLYARINILKNVSRLSYYSFLQQELFCLVRTRADCQFWILFVWSHQELYQMRNKKSLPVQAALVDNAIPHLICRAPLLLLLIH